MGVSTSGNGTFMTLNSKGVTAVDLAGHAEGGVLNVYNYAGSPVCTLDADASGHGVVIVADRRGSSRRFTSSR
jgi:hypothetical protein